MFNSTGNASNQTPTHEIFLFIACNCRYDIQQLKAASENSEKNALYQIPRLVSLCLVSPCVHLCTADVNVLIYRTKMTQTQSQCDHRVLMRDKLLCLLPSRS